MLCRRFAVAGLGLVLLLGACASEPTRQTTNDEHPLPPPALLWTSVQGQDVKLVEPGASLTTIERIVGKPLAVGTRRGVAGETTALYVYNGITERSKPRASFHFLGRVHTFGQTEVAPHALMTVYDARGVACVVEKLSLNPRTEGQAARARLAALVPTCP